MTFFLESCPHDYENQDSMHKCSHKSDYQSRKPNLISKLK